MKRALAAVILAKMIITVILWLLPLLLLPISFLQEQCRAGDLVPVNPLIRLLGLAYGALLVSYGFGYRALRRGIHPGEAVWTGIVSNWGAFLLLGLHRHFWLAWKPLACGLMWASLVATGLIVGGLIAFGPGHRRFHPQPR